MTQLAQVAAGTTSAATAAPQLTPDDVRLLQLVADGLTAREIARKVGCTAHAVADRTSRLYTRMGVRNAPHAVAVAIRAGLLPASDRKGSPL